MKREIRNYISIIAVSIFLTVSSVAVLAGYSHPDGKDTGTREGGDGSGFLMGTGSTFDDTWIPISTPQQLALVGSTGANSGAYPLSGKYYLTNDIMFSGSNFSPIGSQSAPFTGKFDGNGHTISNMNISLFSNISNTYAGLFGYASGAEISNLGMVKGSVTVTVSSPGSSSSSVYAGGIAGYALSTAITNCYNTGSVTASSSLTPTLSSTVFAGGIAGRTSSPISDCYNTGSVTVLSAPTTSFPPADAYAGGIAGQSSSEINNCYNTGPVKVSSSTTRQSSASAGGILGIGQSSPSVNNCYNTGPVTTSLTSTSSSSNAYAGGITGFMPSPSSVNNCYNTGDIKASSSTSSSASAGGITGYMSSSVSNCYNTGDVTASSMPYAYAGGIAGRSSPSSSASITDCYYLAGKLSVNGSPAEDILCGNGTPDSGHEAPDGNGGDGCPWAKTDAMLRSAITASWDFSAVWTMDADVNDGYPTLMSLVHMTPVDVNTAPMQAARPHEENGQDNTAAAILFIAAAGFFGVIFLGMRMKK